MILTADMTKSRREMEALGKILLKTARCEISALLADSHMNGILINLRLQNGMKY